MTNSGGISGLGVAATTAGGLLVWSAIRNVSPLDTLKEVLGKPSQSRPISTPIGSVDPGVRGVGFGSAAAAAAGEVAGVINGGGGRLVQAAEKYLGVRYVFGGTTKSGVDCSGLVVLSFRDIGVRSVPRFTTATFGAWAKQKGATRVAYPNFRPGDVILRSGHMGISLGGDRLIHAPHTGTVVKKSTIWDARNWWGWRFFA